MAGPNKAACAAGDLRNPHRASKLCPRFQSLSLANRSLGPSTPFLTWALERANRSLRNALLTFEFEARLGPQMRRLAGILLLSSLIPAQALACACGCAVFDVGSSALLPKEGDHGGIVYLEWDYSNQNTNWSGTSKAPAINDPTRTFLPIGWSLGRITRSTATGALAYGSRPPAAHS